MERERAAASERRGAGGGPLARYGAIGNCRTAALVGEDGSIDWWCPGRFDAPSVFARILDERRGGHFRIGLDGGARRRLEYEPSTNVLRTTHEARAARLVVRDFMPLGADGTPPEGRDGIVRLATCEEGDAVVKVEFAPRPDYARRAPAFRVRAEGGVAEAGDVVVGLATEVPLELGGGELRARVRLAPGDVKAFYVGAAPREDEAMRPLEAAEALRLLDDTGRFWRGWASTCRHQGEYREAVVRSTLALKLLTHRPTGALVAAPTMSLPEEIGGSRNWDYRYAWLRDTIFAVSAFHESGHLEDALRLAHWVGGVLKSAGRPGDLRILYRVDGRADLEEHELPHLEGYRGSSPVRIGNRAVRQWQLDVFGEVVDCLHACRSLGDHEEEVEWDHMRDVVEYVRRHWGQPDSGIWEMRSEPRQFVVSNLLAWVALDRGVHAIEEQGLPGPLDEWRVARESIRADILRRGYDASRRSFVIAYGETELDAATALVPLVGFLPPTDPRVVATVERIREELAEDGLVYRYRGVDDGVPGDEATFTACTCWVAEALALMGRVAEAREHLEALLARAGPPGLFAEQVDARTGDQVGNYPQALAHIGVINAAAAIARAEARGGGPARHSEDWLLSHRVRQG